MIRGGMIRKTLAVLLVVIIGLLGMAAMKPDNFAVTRSTTIAAPPAQVLALVSDLRRWRSWAPWEARDPGMQRSFSGAASGTGAVYTWAGKRLAGSGRMEITDMAPGAKVVIKLDLVAPLETSGTTAFYAVPQGAATLLTWTVYGPMPLRVKVLSVLAGMDRLLGREIEQGLARLKSVAEGRPVPAR